MGVSVAFSFRSDDISEALDFLQIASQIRRWKCARDGDVAVVSEGSQAKMRLLGGVTLANKDFPKTAVITGLVDGEGESGWISIDAKPAAGANNRGARLGISGRWEEALEAWVRELVHAMQHDLGQPTPPA